MRSIVQVLLFIVVAVIIGIGAQVLISQSREQGAFFDRVMAVVAKQLGGARAVVAPQTAPLAEASGRSLEGTALPPEYEAAVRLTADRLALATQRELHALKTDLVRQEEARDRDSFWTDVRLNTLFMLLGLVVPVLLRRVGVSV